MACSCGGGGANSGMVYKVTSPDGSTEYKETIGEARVIRAAAGPATVIRQVPRAEMEAATEAA